MARLPLSETMIRPLLVVCAAIGLGILTAAQPFKVPPLAARQGASAAATPEIQTLDLDGLKKLVQRDGKDGRPLLVNFWATWCDPCRDEFPDLVKVNNDYGAKKVSFVAISLDDAEDLKVVVPKFLKDNKATMPVVWLNVNDPDPAIKAVDPVWDGQLPATFLYDKDGKVIFKHFGRINAAELRAALDKAVPSNK